MEKRTMTLTRILAELKTIDRKINDGISRFEPISFKVGKKFNYNGLTEDDFAQRAKSSFDSINDLIAYRFKLKCALVKANATTMVRIADLQPISIAEAIDYKSVLEYKKTLLKSLRKAYEENARIVNNIESNNEAKLQQMLTTMLGRDGVTTKADDAIKSTTAAFMETNKVEIVDPINILLAMEKLDNEISAYLTDVDAALSEVNGKTEVTIE